MILKRSHRLPYTRPADIVETDRNGRNNVNFSEILIFLEPGDSVAGMYAELQPVVSVSRCSSDFCHGIKGFGVGSVTVCKENHNAVKAVGFRVTVHEIHRLKTTFPSSAESGYEISEIPYRKDYLVVNSVEAIVSEIVVHPVFPDVFLELFKAVNIRAAVFPH